MSGATGGRGKYQGYPFLQRAGSNDGISGVEAVGKSIKSHETWYKPARDPR